jgi:predicted membrane-bound spermidine synthase
VIVTVFMLGLGLGSLAGGRLSAVSGVRALRAFGLIELSIGAFGISSLWIFHRVAEFTAGKSMLITAIVAFLLLLIPTLLMGSTLPLLVAHLVRRTANVGESVGSAISGFSALAYEIVWYRIYSFTTGGTASSFANLLGFYLFGIAIGSLIVHDLCKKEFKSTT